MTGVKKEAVKKEATPRKKPAPREVKKYTLEEYIAAAKDLGELPEVITGALISLNKATQEYSKSEYQQAIRSFKSKM